MLNNILYDLGQLLTQESVLRRSTMEALQDWLPLPLLPKALLAVSQSRFIMQYQLEH